MYRIAFKRVNEETTYVSHYTWTKEKAIELAEKANLKKPEIHHWVIEDKVQSQSEWTQ